MDDTTNYEAALPIIIQSVIELAKSCGKDLDIKLKTFMKSGLKEYLLRTARRYSIVKTILHRDKPLSIEKVYVSARLFEGRDPTRPEGVFKDDDVLHKVEDGHVVISGSAGAGKSMIMRHLFLKSIADQLASLPIFLEMRRINDQNSDSIEDAITNEIKEFAPDFTGELLKQLLEAGKVILFLDGFDEVYHESQKDLIKQISRISKRYENIRIILSSRPDEIVSGLELFSLYSVADFDKTQAIELIRRVEYNATVKDKFLVALEEEIFEKHKSFASNPLLLSMMLLTYEDYANIPDKIHLFYSQAFDTLFSKHDFYKEGYERRHYAGLSADIFKAVFADFCMRTYFREEYIFTLDDLIEELKNALRREEISAKAENYLKDLLESVCIMQRDGYKYTFVHRSFQEYFAALYLSKRLNVNLRKVLNRISAQSYSNRLIEMLRDMDQDRVDQQWLLPELKLAISSVSDSAKVERRRFVGLFFSEFIIHGVGGFAYAQGSLNKSAYVIMEIIGCELSSVFTQTDLHEEIARIGTKYSKFSKEKYDRLLINLGDEPDEEDAHLFNLTWVPTHIRTTRKSIVVDAEDVDELLDRAGLVEWLENLHQNLVAIEVGLSDRLKRREASVSEIFGE